VISQAVTRIAERRTYGTSHRKTGLPQLSVARWEIKDLAMLPGSGLRETILGRRKVRNCIAAVVSAMMSQMSPSEKQALSEGATGTTKAAGKRKGGDETKPEEEAGGKRKKAKTEPETAVNVSIVSVHTRGQRSCRS
jgi:hypothetical protein